MQCLPAAGRYERSTDHREPKKIKEVQPTAKTSNSQRMGTQWQRDRDCSQVPDSSPHSVSVAQGTGARRRDVSERKTPPRRSQDKRAGRRKPQTKRSTCHSDPGVDVAKKKDELV